MKKSVFTLVIVVLLVAGLLFTALHGIGSAIQPVQKGVVLGLDLVGGSEITYEAMVPENYDESNLAEDMQVARAMLQDRLNKLGYTEASCYISGERRLVVEIPSVENPEQAVQQLGATAVVNFVDADGKIWLTGSDIEDAEYEFSPVTPASTSRTFVWI